MRHSSKHEKPVVRSLHTEVWKCLVWAMSRISNNTDTLARASRVLAQDLKPGVGSRIVGALLHQQDEVLVPEAIPILESLINHPKDTMLHEGVLLLNRLISGIGTSDDYAVTGTSPFDYLSRGLVDGTWLRLDMMELQERLTAGTAPFPVACIRSLTEPEIIANWQELSEFWALTVEKLQKAMTAEQLTTLTGIWQALLLSQAHLTQGQRHLTASTSFATKLATLITRFLTPGEADPETRLTQLSLVRNWWRVLRNVFHNPAPSSLPSSQPTSWLSIPAEIVLSGIMEARKLRLKDPSVKATWIEICSELVDAGAPTLLHVLHTRITTPPPLSDEDDAQETMTVTRQLWSILGLHYLQQRDDVCWTSFAAFLALPFQPITRSCDTWTLEDDELDVWKRVFESMLLNARNDSVEDDKVIESLLAQAGEDAYRRDLIFLRSFETCMGLSEIPICRRSLLLANETLLRLYDAAYGGEKNVALALKLLHALGNMWNLEEVSELASSLSISQDGVAMWLEDRNGLTQSEDHIEMVNAVYVTSLRGLGRHLVSNAASNQQPDLQTLIKLEKLITSAFNSPTPNIAAPQAFMELWRTHYLHRLPLSVCPEWLVTCLKLVSDLFGDRSIGEEASLGTSSPSTVISDSQRSPGNLAATTTPSKVLHREYSRFADLAGAVGFGFQVGPSEMKGEKTPTRQQPQDCETPKASVVPLPWSPEYQSTRPRPPKRHLTEADLPPLGRNCVDDESLEVRRPLKRTKTIAGPSLLPPSSSPVGPTSSPLLADSQRKRGKQPVPNRSLPPSSDVEDDDYDSWEAVILHKDIQDIQQELGIDGDIEVVDNDEQEEDVQDNEDGDDVLPSPTFPLRSRRRERSQTAPELELDDATSPSAHPIPKAEPLRRHYSSSAQLDALQQAYAMVVETEGVSQLPVEDLLKLKRLTSRIGETVDEQIYQQLAKEDDDGGRRVGVRRGRTRGSSMVPD
ncbi:hypothetical protein EST38_g4348 [Candolleomyces aberdarensis]|uniref:Uncharacterized protein n=1 Tax=Candolleomyces aberdarensis TaxID=2316362 RepID=A0A4Q2DN56_9AGAR|nr:hypothetical protein EST38_g4348 [Candolleomyces aberdarensis]